MLSERIGVNRMGDIKWCCEWAKNNLFVLRRVVPEGLICPNCKTPWCPVVKTEKAAPPKEAEWPELQRGLLAQTMPGYEDAANVLEDFLLELRPAIEALVERKIRERVCNKCGCGKDKQEEFEHETR